VIQHNPALNNMKTISKKEIRKTIEISILHVLDKFAVSKPSKKLKELIAKTSGKLAKQVRQDLKKALKKADASAKETKKAEGKKAKKAKKSDLKVQLIESN
jgi:hypothetical protein